MVPLVRVRPWNPFASPHQSRPFPITVSLDVGIFRVSRSKGDFKHPLLESTRFLHVHHSYQLLFLRQLKSFLDFASAGAEVCTVSHLPRVLNSQVLVNLHFLSVQH
jgi:hypothetical protein